MARHPLHPALVHFPIACWSLAVAADIAGLWFGEMAWRWSGGLLAIGCVMALIAMIAGMFELSRVPEGAPMRMVWWHMGLMCLAFALFCTRLLTGLENMHLQEPNTLSLVLDAAGFICLMAGRWLGGTLVYHHGVGRSTDQRTPPFAK